MEGMGYGKEMGRGLVNYPFSTRGFPLTSKIVWRYRQSKITKGAVLAGLGEERVKGER